MPQRVGNSMKLDRPLFITPYKRIASIFAVSRDPKIGSRIGASNRGYDGWIYPIRNDDYLNEVHVKVNKSQKDFEPFEIDCTGYVYEIDVSNLKDHIYRKPWMSPNLEFLLANVDQVQFSNVRTINAHVYVDKTPSYTVIHESAIQEGAWYYNVDRDEIVVDNLPYHKEIDGDDFFEIDELIIPLIKICNQKGYKTRYCCSGHIPHHELAEGKYYKQNTMDVPYIMFDKPYLFTNLPPMWHNEMPAINRDGPYVVVRYNHMPNEFYSKRAKSSKNMELYVNIVKGIQELCRYFEKLPDASKMKVASEEWIRSFGESYDMIQESNVYGKRFDMSRIKSSALRTYLSKYKVFTTNGEEFRKTTNRRTIVACVSNTQIFLFEDDIKRAGLTDNELTCILWHELAHRLLNTWDEKRCDEYAVRQTDESTYRSVVMKTNRLLAELRKEHGITQSEESKKKYGHRDIIKEDYEMEFDRLKKLRAIMEAEDSTTDDDNEEKDMNNDEEETTPKKKAPSRFKKDDDDVDTDTSTEDEDGEMDGSDVDEDDDTDSDDLSDFGNHGGDELPNNEYDPHEVETLNNLMASEADAMNEYLDAARESKVDVLQRLYADIANEERFHMEQLIFAKSEITGEKYVPRDKDVRKEYEELLKLGMDEGSAMATAVDKVGISINMDAETSKDVEKLNEDLKAVAEAFDLLDQFANQVELVAYVLEHAEMTGDDSLIEEVNVYTESFIMEDITATQNVDKKYRKSANPIKLVIQLFVNFVKFISQLSKSSNQLMTQIRYRIGKTREWVEKHSLGELFGGEGVWLYTWNDKQNKLDVDQLAYFVNQIYYLTIYVAQYSKSNDPVIRDYLQLNTPFVISNSAYNVKPKGPLPIVQMLKQAVLTKTKVLVNDNTKDYIMKMFFPEKETENVNFKSNLQYDLGKLMSDGYDAYTIFSIAVARISLFSEKGEKLSEAIGKLESEPNGIFHNDQKTYHAIVDYMKTAAKNWIKISKVVSHDLQAITKIATGQLPTVTDLSAQQQQDQDNQ
jgi:hypothetical protein